MINTEKEFELTPELLAAIQKGMESYLDIERTRKAEAFCKLNEQALKGGIVFAGDSITEGYPVYEMFRGELPVYNRGIAGITSIQLLEHLDAHILQLVPKKVVLLIGTNDLGQNESPKDIAERIKEICSKVLGSCNETKVYVCSVYPVHNSPENARSVGIRTNDMILELNTMLREEIEKIEGAFYLDLFKDLADEEGNLKTSYTTDGLHLSVDGYKAVTKVLEQYVSF